MSSELRARIHKTLIEIPMNIQELAMIISADESDIRNELMAMRRKGIVKNDNQGRYIPAH